MAAKVPITPVLDPNSPSYKGTYSNKRPSDDTEAGDLNGVEAGPGGVMKIRPHRGYELICKNPHGHWSVVGLDEVGTFTGLVQAIAGLDAYLANNPEKIIG